MNRHVTNSLVRWVLCASIVLALSACRSAQQRVVARSFGAVSYAVAKRKPSARATVAQLYQTKLTDVPLPVGSTPLEEFGELVPTDQGMILGYVAKMPLNGVRDFYCEEMEREGWRLVACLEGPEKQLVFEKPSRICLVSLRPAQQGAKPAVQTVLVITVAHR